MTNLIESLTDEQWETINNVIEQYKTDLTEFPEFNEQETRRVINDLYKEMGYPEPIIIIGNNPLEIFHMMITLYEQDQRPLKSLVHSIQNSLTDELWKDIEEQLSTALQTRVGLEIKQKISTGRSNQLWTLIDEEIYKYIDTSTAILKYPTLTPQETKELTKCIYQQIIENLQNPSFDEFEVRYRSYLCDDVINVMETNLEAHLSFKVRSNIITQIRNNLDMLFSSLDGAINNTVNGKFAEYVKNFTEDLNLDPNFLLMTQIANKPFQDIWVHCMSYLYLYCWDCYFSCCKAIGIAVDIERMDLFHRFMKHAGTHLIPYADLCIVSKPIKRAHFKGATLHRENGPAVEFYSSLDTPTFELHALNGVVVPKYLAETESANLDIEFFLKEKNADVKAEFIRKYGIERMLELGTEIDTYENHKNSHNYEWYKKSQYKLYDMSNLFMGYPYLPYLYMANQTVPGVYHLECVFSLDKEELPRTIIEGLAVRMNGINPEEIIIENIA